MRSSSPFGGGHPPRLAMLILAALSAHRIRGGLLGDLEERFHQETRQKGRVRAWIWFWLQAICTAPALASESLYWSITMLKNYFLTTLRNLRKEKLYSFLNIGGLTLGFACALLIGLYVADELSYDSFHEKGERIYRLGASYFRSGRWEPYASNAWRTGDLLREDFPQVENLVRITRRQGVIRSANKRFEESAIGIVDSTFFKLFSFELIGGAPSDVLSGPNKVVLSTETAQKYFGSSDPLGKSLELNDGDFVLTVSGVMQEMPTNSHFRFDLLISSETFRKSNPPGYYANLGWDSQWIYFDLPGAEAADQMLAGFPDFIERHFAPVLSLKNFKLFLQPLDEIYLNPDIGNEIGSNGSMTSLMIFTLIGCITLLIACVNYMNLATARTAGRAREIGMRKVLGAGRAQIARQFLSEAAVFTFFALCLSVLLVGLSLPAFNAFTEKSIGLNSLFTPIAVLAGLSLAAGLALLSGSYPAFLLSAFNPANVLKGQYGGSEKTNARKSLRRLLVIVQFGLAVALIASSGVIYQQLRFLQNKKLGVRKEHVVRVPLQTLPRERYETLRAEVLALPEVLDAGASNIAFPGWLAASTMYEAEAVPREQTEGRSMKQVLVDPDFFPTLGIEIVAGRNFSRERSTDDENALILNETAVKELGWDEAIGKRLHAIHIGEEGRRGRVVGVVRDFHFESLHHPIAPIVFAVHDPWLQNMYVRLEARAPFAAIERIEEIFSTFVTDREFRFHFLEDELNQLYATETRFMQVFTMFTGLAITIACLGMIGMASFTTERRAREIAVRKVIGASVTRILALLLSDFFLTVLVASFLALPFAWIFARTWLENFAYRITLSLDIFGGAVVLALVIATATVTAQALRAAFRNPIENIRSE